MKKLHLTLPVIFMLIIGCRPDSTDTPQINEISFSITDTIPIQASDEDFYSWQVGPLYIYSQQQDDGTVNFAAFDIVDREIIWEVQSPFDDLDLRLLEVFDDRYIVLDERDIFMVYDVEQQATIADINVNVEFYNTGASNTKVTFRDDLFYKVLQNGFNDTFMLYTFNTQSEEWQMVYVSDAGYNLTQPVFYEDADGIEHMLMVSTREEEDIIVDGESICRSLWMVDIVEDQVDREILIDYVKCVQAELIGMIDNTLYVTSTNNLTYVLDVDSGELLNSYTVTDNPLNMSLQEDHVFVYNINSLVIYDNGMAESHYTNFSIIPIKVEIANQSVMFRDQNDGISGVDINSGESLSIDGIEDVFGAVPLYFSITEEYISHTPDNIVVYTLNN